MMKIYTPDAWLSIFGGSPSLVIDDKGYIYSADGYYKIFSDSPIGRIDFAKGNIYDKHYTDIFPTPIAYMIDNNGVLEVREYGKSRFADPILYIQGEKIYTPKEYFRFFGGNPSGYIEKDPTPKATAAPRDSIPTPSSDRGTSDVGMPFSGLFSLLGVVLIVGIIYLISDEKRLADSATALAMFVNVCALGYFLVQVVRGKRHFAWNGKRFAKGLLIGIGIYVAATAILVLLGLGSNVGTGHHISDEGTNQLELAAMLMGLPCVLSGLFAEGKKPVTAKTYTPPMKAAPQPVARPATHYTAPVRLQSPTQSPRETLYRVLVGEYGEKAVFPNALIGRDTAVQADFLVRVQGYANVVFFVVSSPSDKQAYQRAWNAGKLWEARGAYWFIVYEKDCYDPKIIKSWVRSAMEKAVRR